MRSSDLLKTVKFFYFTVHFQRCYVFSCKQQKIRQNRVISKKNKKLSYRFPTKNYISIFFNTLSFSMVALSVSTTAIPLRGYPRVSYPTWPLQVIVVQNTAPARAVDPILDWTGKCENIPVCSLHLTGIYFNFTHSLLVYGPPNFWAGPLTLHSCHGDRLFQAAPRCRLT